VKVNLKYVFVCCLLTGTSVCGQLAINFETHFENDPLIVGKKYSLKMDRDSVSIEELKFYVSNIEFLFNEAVVYKATGNYFLMDIHDSSSQRIHFPTKHHVEYNRVRFCIGIDSLTNSSGALGGVLDPTRDMYWSWQSGYINLKLEGYCNTCDTRNNAYKFHIGGYQHPNKIIQMIDLWTGVSEPVIVIQCEKLLEDISIGKICEIMSPGDRAIFFANRFKQAFVLEE
jgi:hypothetical protein